MWLRRRKSYRLWTHVSLFVPKPFQDPSSIFRIQVNTHRDRFLRYQTVVFFKKSIRWKSMKTFPLEKKEKNLRNPAAKGPRPQGHNQTHIIYTNIQQCRWGHGLPGGASGKRTRLPMRDIKETRVWSRGWEDSLEEGMAIHSSILTWRFPWTEEPGGLQSTRLPGVRHDCNVSTHRRGYSSMSSRTDGSQEVKGRRKRKSRTSL